MKKNGFKFLCPSDYAVMSFKGAHAPGGKVMTSDCDKIIVHLIEGFRTVIVDATVKLGVKKVAFKVHQWLVYFQKKIGPSKKNFKKKIVFFGFLVQKK